MRVAVLGSGAIGGTIAKAWRASGHEVSAGVRDVQSERARSLASQLGEGAVKPVGEALAQSDVVLFAIPGAAMPEVVSAVAKELEGKLVIDASNNIQAPVRNSLAVISSAAPSARVFRAFNSLPSQTLARPSINGQPADLFFCGPEGSDQVAIETLIKDAGLNPVYVGGTEWAPVVDALGGLSFALGRSRPGTRLALNLVTA